MGVVYFKVASSSGSPFSNSMIFLAALASLIPMAETLEKPMASPRVFLRERTRGEVQVIGCKEVLIRLAWGGRREFICEYIERLTEIEASSPFLRREEALVLSSWKASLVYMIRMSATLDP